MLGVVALAVSRVVVLSAKLGIIVLVAVLRVVVATLVIVILIGLPAATAIVGPGWLVGLAWDAGSRNLYQLENARNAAQDRHGFAPRFGFATGTCLVRTLIRITTPPPLLVADARRWMQRAKQIHASFELPAHGHELSPDPRLDGSDRNPEIFRDLLVRAPIDDRQKQARAALWLELIEHGP